VRFERAQPVRAFRRNAASATSRLWWFASTLGLHFVQIGRSPQTSSGGLVWSHLTTTHVRYLTISPQAPVAQVVASRRTDAILCCGPIPQPRSTD